jgi:hypothetical protein
MTVAELLDLLAEYPGDPRPVVVSAYDETAFDVVSVDRYEDAIVLTVEPRA